MSNSVKIEVRMRDAFPRTGTATRSEILWSHRIPASGPRWSGPDLSGPVTARPGHELRMLDNICFGVPLVVGDVVETAPSGPGRPLPRVVTATALREGLLVIADGYAELSRTGPGEPVGPGVSDLVCGCGRCTGPGLDGHWWRWCRAGLMAHGVAMAETDGDRIVAFFADTVTGQAGKGHRWCRAEVAEICCAAGMVRDTLQIVDREARRTLLGPRLVGTAGEADDDIDGEVAAA